MPQTANAPVASHALIAADRIAGTAVYDTAANHIGEVHDLMIDKASGQVAYAILSFGGFLGLGERYYPVPWNLLTYDVKLAGYVVPIDRSKLDAAPNYDSRGQQDLEDEASAQRIHDFYGIQPYWTM